tara:strand:- start:208 stop:423 length:216 start_codon:yes stop_codon:yes gene_type:complete
MKVTFFTTLLYFYYFSSSAFAYIDPGSGSIILQAILGFIAAAITGLSFYWNKVKIFISEIFKKNKNKKPNQ